MLTVLLRLFGLLALLAAYSWWIEPRRLSITRIDVSDPDQPLANPMRVLLLTDWHLGRFSCPRVLRAKMERLLRLHRENPFDMALLGGDFVDTDAQYLGLAAPALDLLAQMGIPMIAVPGNHDYTAFHGDISPVMALLESRSVTVLRNQSVAVTAGNQRILVIGLDDLQESRAYYSESEYKKPNQYRQAALEMDWYARFDEVEPDTPRLLLAHNPDAVYLPGRKPMAVLSGHTHGGQIMLLDWVSRPLHRWLHLALPPGSAVTWAGCRTVNGRTLIVSRGMEGSALPLRLLRPPEAVVVTLR